MTLDPTLPTLPGVALWGSLSGSTDEGFGVAVSCEAFERKPLAEHTTAASEAPSILPPTLDCGRFTP